MATNTQAYEFFSSKNNGQQPVLRADAWVFVFERGFEAATLTSRVVVHRLTSFCLILFELYQDTP